MFSQFSNKNKLLILGIGSVLFLLLAYQLAIGKTVALYQKSKELEKNLAGSESIAQEIITLQQKRNKSAKKQEQFDEEWIFEVVTELCSKLDITIADLQQGEHFEYEQTEVITHQILLKGAYKNILQVMFAIEQEFKIGAIISTNFYKQKNRATKQEELYCHLYLRNIKPIKK